MNRDFENSYNDAPITAESHEVPGSTPINLKTYVDKIEYSLRREIDKLESRLNKLEDRLWKASQTKEERRFTLKVALISALVSFLFQFAMELLRRL